MGMMNRHAKRDDTLQAMELFDEWMQWNLLANGWLSKTHVEFVVQLPLGQGDAMSARKRSYWIPPELVGTRDDRKAPLFLRADT